MRPVWHIGDNVRKSRRVSNSIPLFAKDQGPPTAGAGMGAFAFDA